MKTVISPGNQLTFRPIKSDIKEELEFREGNKDYVYNLTPFVRVSCLQEVSYTEQDQGKGDSLKDTADSVLTDSTQFNGFQFIFDSDFEEAYGTVQKIGQTLDGDNVKIKNPRRVPPPALTSFNATVGEGSDYFTTATLNFTCNSLQQLQFLVPFLFNPGNTIFVEFGHNTDKLKNQITFFDKDDARKLVNSTVIKSNCNDTSVDSEEGFIERMNKRIFKSGGAYDFFYGIVNNFDFSINESLGFDCKVDLISATKMKLKAPNTDDYNNPFDGSPNNISKTLQSKLKQFENILEEENKLARDKDVIFSFGGSDSTKYVRLNNLLKFLNGDYTKKPEWLKDYRDRTFVSIDRSVNRSPLRAQTYDTILNGDYRILAKKTHYGDSEPPVVSYSNDVLFFRKKKWAPMFNYNKNNSSYSIVSESIDRYVDGSALLTDDSGISMSSALEDRVIDIHTINTNFKIIRPYLLDSYEDQDDKLENLGNAYINFGKFKSIFESSNGRVLDVINKLSGLIKEATDETWNLEWIKEAVSLRENNGTEDDGQGSCEQSVTAGFDLNSTDIQRNGDTYTFKVNSKSSVFTSIDFGLGLEGLLGNQIYMNSINSPDGSVDSQKLNLLLFSNHENNLNIKDKRNQRIASLRKNEDSSTGAPIDSGGFDDTDSSVNKKEIPIDYKKDFLSKNIITRYNQTGKTPRTGVSSVIEDSDDGEASAYKFVNSIADGDNPLKNLITDINEVNLTNWQGTSSPLTRSEIHSSFKFFYGIELVPFDFSPVKGAIDKIRAGNTDNIAISDNNGSSGGNDERGKSFKKGGINPLLESSLDLTLPGIGGINPLEYVNISGIPDAFAKRGQFCIMNVSHTVTPSDWETQISTRFRPNYEDE